MAIPQDPVITQPEVDPITAHVAAFLGALKGDYAPGTFGAGETAQAGADQTLNRAVATSPVVSAPRQPADKLGGDGWQSGSWAHDLLAYLGMPVTYENVRFLDAWQRAETGGKNKPAYNWLATTRKTPDLNIAGDFNSAGVKNYASYHDGLVATAGALTNGLYGGILAALKNGNSATAAAQAVAASKWGTGDGVLRALGGK